MFCSSRTTLDFQLSLIYWKSKVYKLHTDKVLVDAQRLQIFKCCIFQKKELKNNVFLTLCSALKHLWVSCSMLSEYQRGNQDSQQTDRVARMLQFNFRASFPKETQWADSLVCWRLVWHLCCSLVFLLHFKEHEAQKSPSGHKSTKLAQFISI